MSLITKKDLKKREADLGIERLLEEHNRRTGRSTKLAFFYLHEALSNPTSNIQVKDHYGSLMADELLLRHMSDIVHTLGLNYFTFNLHDCTVTYTYQNPFDEYSTKEPV